MIIDAVIALALIVALFLGYQRGVIQPLMAEIFFFATLLLIFRFHDQYTNEMQKLFHINPVLSVFVALILAVILGAIGGAIGGAFHRLEAIRGIDGLLGVFVHVAVTIVVIYLAVSALVVLDNAFEQPDHFGDGLQVGSPGAQDRRRQTRGRKHRFGGRHPPAAADLCRFPPAAAAWLEGSADHPLHRIASSVPRPCRAERPEAAPQGDPIADTEGQPVAQPAQVAGRKCSTWR